MAQEQGDVVVRCPIRGSRSAQRAVSLASSDLHRDRRGSAAWGRPSPREERRGKSATPRTGEERGPGRNPERVILSKTVGEKTSLQLAEKQMERLSDV